MAAVPLQFLIDEGMRLLAHCLKCGRCVPVDVAPIAAKFGADFPIPHVGKRMRCTRCGSRLVDTMPYWNDKSIRGAPTTFAYPTQLTGEHRSDPLVLRC